MRVTELTKHTNIVQNMNNNSEDLQDLMIGLSSGKQVNKPSDDPVGTVTIQDFKTSINYMNTIERNINADMVWLNAMESKIGQMVDILRTAKTNALDAANGTASQESRNVLAAEIDSLIFNLVSLANAKEGKLYLFSGTKTFTKPLVIQDKVSSPKIEFNGSRIKSQTQIKPIDQREPLLQIKKGSFDINIIDPENNSQTLTIYLEGKEKLAEIIKKINLTAIEKEGFVENRSSITGYNSKIFAHIADYNNSVYIDPLPGYRIELGKDDTNFLNLMKFGIIGKEIPNSNLPYLGKEEKLDELLDASFEGFSNNKYIFRIVKSGDFNEAEFSVSDDGGKTWGPHKILQKFTALEAYNSEGKASDKVILRIGEKKIPYFIEGLEFHFEGNPFSVYKGNDQIKEVMLDNQIMVPMNITAKQLLFKNAEEETVNIIDSLHSLKENMYADDQMNIVKGIENIEIGIDQILKQRGKIGVISKQLESSLGRIDSEVFSKTKELAEIEDLNLPEAVTDLNSAELKHKASLDATSRLIQPSLIQFLR